MVIVCLSLNAVGQTIIYTQDFESGATDWTLNTTDLGANAGGNNNWVINNEFLGGGVNVPNNFLGCGDVGTVLATVPDVPNQPAAITGFPQSNYLHLLYDPTFFGYAYTSVLNAHHFIADPTNFCVQPVESYFVKMNTGISTIGQTGVSVSFWWTGITASQAFGTMYYSIDGGITWIVGVTNLFGESNWKQETLTLAAFDNQADLRIAFDFLNGDSGGTDMDHAFSVDEVIVSAPVSPPVADFDVNTDTICVNECINYSDISTNSPTSWLWNFDGATTSTSTAQNPGNVCYTTAGTFAVTLTASNAGGSDSEIKTTYIKVNALPAADAGANVSICEGNSTNLSASGGSTYQWTPTAELDNSSISNPVATPTSSTYFFVSVTDVNGCEQIDSVLITVNTLPTADAGANVTICEGESTNLSASGGVGYVWSPSTALNAASISNPTAMPSSTTTYFVTVTDGNNCEASDSVQVTVNPLPTADAGPDITLCNGSSTGLSASGGTGYLWSPSTGLSSTTIMNPNVTTTVTTTYTVTVTDVNGCVSTDDIVVNVSAGIVADAGSNTTICEGAAASLVASGGTGYSWSPTGSLSDPLIANPSATPTSTTTYYVTVTSGTCNPSVDSVQVLVNPLPIADAGSDISFCSGSNGGLNASGGVSYQWSPSTGLSDPNIAGPTVTITVSQNYTVSVTDGNGCVDTDQVMVSITNGLTVDAGSDLNICTGKDTILSASGGTTFSWSPSTGLSSTSIANPTASPTSTTKYFVTITDGGACQGVDSVIVTVNSLPNADAGTDLNVCEGESDNLNGSGGVSYVWSPGTGLNDNTISNPTVTPTSSLIYTVTVTDANGCVATDDVQVTVIAPITANAGEDVSVCKGKTAQLLASGGTSYAWSPGSGLSDSTIANPIASPLETTSYLVSVSADNCPTSTDEVIVNVVSAPDAEAGPDVTISFGNSAELNGEGGVSYVWSPSGSLSCDDCQNPIATPEVTTTYTVTVTDENGCDSLDMVTVLIDQEHSLFIPNIFSPNGDGSNDVYQVHGSGIVTINVKIYDRWGTEIFEITKLEESWDGTHRGSLMNSDAFAYFLEVSYVDGTSESKKGTITLVR